MSSGATEMPPTNPPTNPKRLVLLEPTSRPLFTVDPLAFKRDSTSSLISFAIHAGIVLLVVALALTVHTAVTVPQTATVTPVDVPVYIPPPVKIAVVAPVQGGGGGGGLHEIVKPTQGKPPVMQKTMIVVAPQVARIIQPKLIAMPTTQVKLPENSKLPNLGMAQSPQIVMASQGSGSNSGFGSGMGGGIGAGSSNGMGVGNGGGYGGGVMSVGGGVSAPQIVKMVDPEFTEAARSADFQGDVAIHLIVDSQGNPQDIHVVRSLGMGLDQKAIEAVRQYKFRPALYQGHPVSVQIVVDVAFHLH
jgi:protein TonB